MNALHIESERQLCTVAALLTGRHQVQSVLVDGLELTGGSMTAWLKAHLNDRMNYYDRSCGQRHYTLSGGDDYTVAVVAVRA